MLGARETMSRSYGIAVALLAASAMAAAAQTARYGNPSGCAGTPNVAPYLLYDGRRLVTAAGWACDVTPAGGKIRGQCSGTPGTWVEDFTISLTAGSAVEITRADGARLMVLPLCR
jgi:hypothetical protein